MQFRAKIILRDSRKPRAHLIENSVTKISSHIFQQVIKFLDEMTLVSRRGHGHFGLDPYCYDTLVLGVKLTMSWDIQIKGPD